jgi:hypothetical protein
MESPYIPDMLAFLQTSEKWVGDELDLNQLQIGDRLLVRTRNTNYLFAMTGEHTAELSSDRTDRPSGPVQIQGCVFGRSRMIKPGHLFCGGGLEITFDEGRQAFTTTPISAIQMIKVTPPAGGTPPQAQV